ncbi:hypothetical protein [Pseudomonas sp. H9]|uniref:hypothetical protein n=1 Tax=Pseudomonas sp. H9 TaxID=483968 RepID=UPI0010581CAA|nr:hypothetical protein [Pseudomonas sp. H9]TDF77716.1 hypothetical protein E1573_26570 [Pseudomonas sp. H9]
MMSTPCISIVSRKQLLEAVPGLEAKTLAYALRNRHNNGLAASGAILRPGNAFLFDLEVFVTWLRSRKAV